MREIKPIEDFPWETFNSPPCVPGCWCRGIRAVKLGRGRKRIVIHCSFLDKKQADLIVRIHNEWLNPKIGQRPESEVAE